MTLFKLVGLACLAALNLLAFSALATTHTEAGACPEHPWGIRWKEDRDVTFSVHQIANPCQAGTTAMREAIVSAFVTWNFHNETEYVNCSNVSFAEATNANITCVSVDLGPNGPVAKMTGSVGPDGYRGNCFLQWNYYVADPWVDCNKAESYANFVYRVTMHEIGHSMGINHPTNPVRGGSVMNNSVDTPANLVSVNDTKHWNPNDVTACDDGSVRANYISNCFPTDRRQPQLLACVQVQNPAKAQTVGDCDSPIIVDVDGSGFPLTDWQTGVIFDMGGDGAFEQSAWTVTTSSNCFLALDRNGNGKIDSGLELFGNKTAQPTTADPNGYFALQVFDESSYGGNGDGYITAADSVFSNLRLWCDSNHNGVSNSGELFTLQQKGVQALMLDARSTIYEDSYGNMFRFKSKAVVNGVVRQTYDVYFMSASWTSAGKSAVLPVDAPVTSQRGVIPRGVKSQAAGSRR